ncbi:hypothetical protein ABIA35_005611 [Catenulispora sp. MAP12-49]|uniref:hypothetical protein n=1 Tax=unclassified Catenulispora TaxID=414885 RepID=UPI003514BEF2
MEFMDLSKPEYSYMFGFLQTDGTLTQGKGLKGRVSVEIQRVSAGEHAPPTSRSATSPRWWVAPPSVDHSSPDNGGIALERKQSTADSVAAWTRPAGMRRRSETRRWTPEQDAVVLASSVADAAQILGRAEQSCYMRRWRLAKPGALG